MRQGTFQVTLRSKSEWDRETFNVSGVKVNGPWAGSGILTGNPL